MKWGRWAAVDWDGEGHFERRARSGSQCSQRSTCNSQPLTCTGSLWSTTTTASLEVSESPRPRHGQSLCTGHARSSSHHTRNASRLFYLQPYSALYRPLSSTSPRAMHPPQDDPATVHGLHYPPSFLDVLPVLRPRPDPHPPIRALTVDQFSDLHLAHITTHAPDHVLFPFLHGLEGDNEQQNAFFASSRPRGEVPRFRGLVWVACDEDEDDICDVDDLEDDDDDDYSTTSSLDSFGPTDLEDDVAMQLDPTVEGPMVSGCPPPAPLEKLPAPPRPIPFTAGHLPLSSGPQSAPSVLTSSFRARDLLRMRAEGDGTPVNVFVEPKIPDGISLRNFGIQVVSVAFPFSLWRWRTVWGVRGWGRRDDERSTVTVARLSCRACHAAPPAEGKRVAGSSSPECAMRAFQLSVSPPRSEFVSQILPACLAGIAFRRMRCDLPRSIPAFDPGACTFLFYSSPLHVQSRPLIVRYSQYMPPCPTSLSTLRAA